MTIHSDEDGHTRRMVCPFFVVRQ